MGLLRKIVRKIENFIYSIPFGMKGGDEIIATSNPNNVAGSEVHKKVTQTSVLQDLLNGEVTQEVEELRYETFKVEEESNNYKHIGNGVCIKIDDTEDKKKERRKKFIQENIVLDYGAIESVNITLDDDVKKQMDFPEKRLFNCTYDNECVKFRLEKYFEKVAIDLRKDNLTKLYFIDTKYNKKGVPVINALKKIMNDISSLDEDNIDTYIKKCEIISSIKTMEFTSFNASNNVPNGIYYKFLEPKFIKLEKEGDCIVLQYVWDKKEGGQLLSEKYFSPTGARKFKNKEKRSEHLTI